MKDHLEEKINNTLKNTTSFEEIFFFFDTILKLWIKTLAWRVKTRGSQEPESLTCNFLMKIFPQRLFLLLIFINRWLKMPFIYVLCICQMFFKSKKNKIHFTRKFHYSHSGYVFLTCKETKFKIYTDILLLIQ